MIRQALRREAETAAALLILRYGVRPFL